MNVCAVTVRFGAVALHAVVEPVPAAMFVAAQFPEVAEAPLVPAGVPALTADVVALDPVKVSAGTVPALPVNVGAATVPAGVYEFIASVGWLTVPVGVIVALPPLAPTSPFAATVPRSIFPLNAETSLHPEGQEPLTMKVSSPLGIASGEAAGIVITPELRSKQIPAFRWRVIGAIV